MYRSSTAAPRSLLIVAFRGRLFATDRITGKTVWRTEIDDLGNSTAIDIAISEHVVVACSLNRLSFVDYATGTLLASANREESGRPTMLIDGEQLLVGGLGAVACYTLGGQLLWREGFRGEGHGPVTIGFPGNVRQAE